MGKTTVAAALATEFADAGQPTLVVSVDPAHSLGDAFGHALGPEPGPVPGVSGLVAMEVDADHERRRFLGTRRGLFLELLDRGTWLERADAEELVDLAAPGVDETAALLRLMELTRDERRIVVDTAPTGHTLRLLDLPEAARGWLGALAAMEAEHRAVAGALAGAYTPDAAARLLEDLSADLDRLTATLRDPRRTRFVLVTNPEPVVLAETRRYRSELESREIALAGIVVNRSGPQADPAAIGQGMVFVPSLSPEPRGPGGLRRYAAAARAEPSPAAATRAGASSSLELGPVFRPPADRELYVVAGKGGVGKSTTAAGLAARLAELGRRVLLFGVDPAGSLADVLGSAPAEGVAVRQIDAAAAWARLRDDYRGEAERLFGAVVAGAPGGSDQAVVERLVDLAPPGVDELVALLEVLDAIEDRAYDALVLDTAPTGHLLRLLELPDQVLEWTRMLLRLLLKYREVVGLGPLAERVLHLSRGVRDLRDRLRDPARCWILAVALPEVLSVAETGRLLARLEALGNPAAALLVNRLVEDGRIPESRGGPAAALAALRPGSPMIAAPDLRPAPRGAGALAEFTRAWRTVRSPAHSNEPDRS